MKDFYVRFTSPYTRHRAYMDQDKKNAAYLPGIKNFISQIPIVPPVDTSQVHTFGGLCKVLNGMTTKENLIKYIRSCKKIYKKATYKTDEVIYSIDFPYQVGSLVCCCVIKFYDERTQTYKTRLAITDKKYVYYRIFSDTDLSDECRRRIPNIPGPTKMEILKQAGNFAIKEFVYKTLNNKDTKIEQKTHYDIPYSTDMEKTYYVLHASDGYRITINGNRVLKFAFGEITSPENEKCSWSSDDERVAALIYFNQAESLFKQQQNKLQQSNQKTI